MQMQEINENRDKLCTTSKFISDGKERRSLLEHKMLKILCRELNTEHEDGLEEYIIVW